MVVPRLGFLIVVALSTVSSAPANDADQAEQLKGEWIAVEGVRDGKSLSNKQLVKISISFTGSKEGFPRSHRIRLETLLPHGAKTDGWGEPYRLEPEKSPKRIAVFQQCGARYSVYPGIYELKENSLRLCVNLQGWGSYLARRPQPIEFASREGSGLTLLKLKKVKR